MCNPFPMIFPRRGEWSHWLFGAVALLGNPVFGQEGRGKEDWVPGEPAIPVDLTELAANQDSLPAWIVALLVALACFAVSTVVAALWGRSMRRAAQRGIRQQEKLAAQLRASYEAVEEGIVACDLEGTIIAANRRAGEVTERKLEIGGHIRSLLDYLGSGSEENDVAFWEGVNRSTEVAAVRLMLPVLDGHGPARFQHLRVTSSPIQEGGLGIGRLWVLRDDTEKRQLEDSLLQAQKMEAIGTLVGGIAHDFNNLLTGVTGNLAIASVDPGKTVAEVRPELEAAADAAHRGAELIRKLLGFSRKTSLSIEPITVRNLLASLRPLLRHSFDRSIRLEIEDPPADLAVAGDATHLEHVLLNLCVNARDAMPQGGKIQISATTRDEYGDSWAVIRVRDTGIGMPEKIRAQIFDPFFTTKPPGEGTGLGLAMSYGIVEQHGGKMECRSREGDGAEFEIFLPLEEPPSKDNPAPAPRKEGQPKPAEPTAGKSSDGQGETILVVDDEAVVRAVAVGVLRKSGYQVVPATGGQEALDILEKERSTIAAVLLDLTMPGMSGKEVLIQAKRRWPEIPIVICSGYALESELFDPEAEAQPEGLIQKPYPIEKLLATIRQVLDAHPASLPAGS